MATVNKMDATIQVARGARTSWHPLSGTPVPNLKYIYDLQTRTIKRGDGMNFLEHLPIWLDLGKIEDIDTFFKEYFFNTKEFEENKLLILNGAENIIEFSAQTIGEFVNQLQLNSILQDYADKIHIHETDDIDNSGNILDRDIGLNEGQIPIVSSNNKLPKRLFTNTTGINSKQSDIVSYLLLARLAREDGALLSLPNGIVDEFNTDDTVSNNDGYYEDDSYLLPYPSGVIDSINYKTDKQISKAKVFIRGKFVDEINKSIKVELSRTGGTIWNIAPMSKLPMVNGEVDCYSGVCDLEAILNESRFVTDDAEFENVKGDISTFTRTTEQTGKFNHPINSRIKKGSIINTDGGTISITDISGDGTEDSAIEFTSTLENDEVSVLSIQNLEIVDQLIVPTSYQTFGSIDHDDGTNLGNMLSTDDVSGINKIFNGSDEGGLDESGYWDGSSSGWFGKQYDSPRIINNVKITAPIINDETNLVSAGSCTAYLELSNDPAFSEYLTGATESIPFGTRTLTMTNSVTDTYTCWRIRIVSTDEENRTQIISADVEATITLYNGNFNSFYIPAADEDIKNLVAVDVLGEGNIYVSFKSGDKVKIFRDSTWVDIVKYENNAWSYRSSGNWMVSSPNTYLSAVSAAMNDYNNRLPNSQLSNLPQYTSGSIDGIVLSIRGNDETRSAYSDNEYLATIGLSNLPEDTLIPTDHTTEWNLSKYEDIKDGISKFIVDTDNHSGHFDSPINNKIIEGCNIYLHGLILKITTISEDGTEPNSVEFNGTINSGTYDVNKISGIDKKGKITAANVYTCIADIKEYAQLSSITSVSDPNVYYAVGNDTEYYVYTNDAWETVVRYIDEHWTYKSGSNWLAAPINTPQSALSKVIENVVNRMTRDQLSDLSIDQFDTIDITKVAAIMRDSVLINKTLSTLTIEGYHFIGETEENNLKWRIVSSETQENNILKGIRIQYK